MDSLDDFLEELLNEWEKDLENEIIKNNSCKRKDFLNKMEFYGDFAFGKAKPSCYISSRKCRNCPVLVIVCNN